MELVDGYQLDEAEHVANTLKPVDSGDLLIVQNMHQLCKAVETIVSKVAKNGYKYLVIIIEHE
jgi:Holliday junction resolvasome RuvABC ATP-dependent DNA helicase subunit